MACSSGSFEVATPQDATLDDATGDATGDATLDAPDTALPDALPDVTPDTPISEIGPTGCDPAEQPGAGAIFVDANALAGGDGSKLRPFKTIAAAMNAAGATTSRIALAPGQYKEAVDFKADGVMIEGGWSLVGAVWTRDCAAGARAKTVIASPTPIAIFADSRAKRSGLRTLTVSTKPSCGVDAEGVAESCIGVYVLNGTAPFVLRDVDVVAGNGGHGVKGADGVAGAPGPAAGKCKCGTGAKGADGGGGANANPGGYGTARGFTPGNGKEGIRGDDGQAGTAGSDGKSATCTTGCTGDTQCVSISPCSESVSVVSGAGGACGCGGTAGQPGKGGGGGGASIGILASGGATLQIELHDVTVTATNGGDGALGGGAAKGADGSPGAEGASATCASGCARKIVSPCGCFTTTSTTLSGGSAGGAGGAAGGSGAGSGGAGGASITLVNIGGATYAPDAATPVKLTFGARGNGAGTAPDGFAGQHFP